MAHELRPQGIGEIRIGAHRSHALEKGPVRTLADPIVLRHVVSRQLANGAVRIKERGEFLA